MEYCSVLTWHLILSLVSLCVLCMSDKPITFTIEEEQDGDALIGNLKETTEMRAKYSLEVLHQLRFSFLKSDQQYAYFSIAEETGEIRTRQRIDRETVCVPSAAVCSMNLTVMIKPDIYFSFVKVVVHVRDINDHSPQFPQPNLRWSFAETASIGSKFSLPSADDLDAGQNGIQTYELISRSDKFRLDVTNNSDGSINVNLVLRSALDRETEESYLLKLVAKDGGTPVKSGALIIDITVTDSNDNSPTFDVNSYEAVIHENARVRTTVVQVHATDPDTGQNGQVTYSLAPQTMAQFGGIFGIENQTGEVYVKGTIDYEQTKLYQLSIKASDGTLSAFCKVIIRVTDVNDHTPDIVVDTLTGSGEAHVAENADIATFVAHIAVDDQDTGVNGEIECSIDDALFRLLEMSEGVYKLVTAVVFDREAVDLYEVTIFCLDHGSPKETSSSVIIVRIIDDNDHSPQLNVTSYFMKFAENNTLGQFVIQVNATDSDIGANGRLLYRIDDAEGSSGTMLAIGASSGVVTARKVFDYEKKRHYEYIITVSDMADTPKSVTAMLNLTVTDVNDELPEFNKSRYNFNITENRPPRTQVGTVTATDGDDTPFNKVLFALDPRSTNGSFSINPYTGSIFTTSVLDREHCATYYLKVTAMNEGYSTVRSSVIATVHILDVNDNAPVVLFPSRHNNTVEIADTASVGSVITRISATDPDAHSNGMLSYTITNGNENNLFKLDPQTGAVTIANDIGAFLGSRDHRACRLVIVVKDHGQPPLSVITDLNIVINKSTMLLGGVKPSGSSQNDNGGSSNFMILIGVVCGAICLIIAITIAILVIKFRQRKQRKNRQYNSHLAATELNNIPLESTNNSLEKTMESSGNDRSLDADSELKKQIIKKEVTFNFDVDGAHVDRIPVTWPLQPDRGDVQRLTTNDAACRESEKEALSDKWNFPSSSKMRFCEQLQSSRQSYEPLIPKQPQQYSHMEEADDVSHGDRDSESESAESYTDSGRGNSEEGDNCRHGDPFNTECRDESDSKVSSEKEETVALRPDELCQETVALRPDELCQETVALRPDELCRLHRNSSFNAALNNEQSLTINPPLLSSSWATRKPHSDSNKLRHNQVEPLPNGIYYVPPPVCNQRGRFQNAKSAYTNNAALMEHDNKNGVLKHAGKHRKEVRFAEVPTYLAQHVDTTSSDSHIMDAVDADLARGVQLDMLGGGEVMTV